jgi:mutator protein MutT
MAHAIKPSVNVYVINGGKLLLSRRANTGWADGMLCAPGGHVEQGETPTQAMIREIEEELGVTVKANDLEFLCVAARNSQPNEYVAYEFMVRDKNYTFINNEAEKCSELVWVDPANLPNDVIDDFRLIIQKSIMSDDKYLEIGYE